MKSEESEWILGRCSCEGTVGRETTVTETSECRVVGVDRLWIDYELVDMKGKAPSMQCDERVSKDHDELASSPPVTRPGVDDRFDLAWAILTAGSSSSEPRRALLGGTGGLGGKATGDVDRRHKSDDWPGDDAEAAKELSLLW